MKAWSHLPNAHYIDWVLESLDENPKLWIAAMNVNRGADWGAARGAAWGAVSDATRDAVYDAVSDAAWDAVSDATRDAVYDAAWDAILALVAYDDCDQFLNMSYKKLQVWAVLSETPCAMLILPMIYVKEHLNEQCMVTLA